MLSALATATTAAPLRLPQTACRGARSRPSAGRPWAAVWPAPVGRRHMRAAAEAASGSPSSTEPEVEGLLPEEDQEIPGSYRDAMSSNTALGKAVKGACEELDTLGELERQTLEEAEGLLKKLGFKGSLFTAPQQQQPEQTE